MTNGRLFSLECDAIDQDGDGSAQAMAGKPTWSTTKCWPKHLVS